MKEILLHRRWVGAIALVIYSLIVAILGADIGVKFVQQSAPIVEQELNVFLPITFSGGEIVSPRDTIISRVYGSGNNVRKVVLDTRAEEFETSALKDEGIYVSRKYVYAVSSREMKITSLKEMPDITIDSEVLHETRQIIENRAGVYIFCTVFVFFLLFAAVAVGLYSLAMHWALKGLFANSFAQTIRINTYAYILISGLTLLIGYNISIVITFVILFGVNYGVNKWLQEAKKSQ
ncbi:MAG: hypothetical protein IJ677_02340 [Alphaproteobacteria bacterium]|nr:hypothetical protein [Alphaproteobacteria bacterium]